MRNVAAAVAVVVVTLLASDLAARASTLATGAVVVSDLGRYDAGRDVAVTPDGDVVVAAYAGVRQTRRARFAVLRYSPSGVPNRSFGDGGVATVRGVRALLGAETIAVQPDGRIVAAGSTSEWSSSRVVVARYLPDGTPDPSFADGDGVRVARRGGCGMSAADLALAPDGAIVIAGTAGCGGEGGEGLRAAVLRLHPDGTPDGGFGRHGFRLVRPGCAGMAVAVRPDGQLLLAGEAGGLDYCAGPMFIAALGPDGRLDHSFANQGRLTIPFRGYNAAVAHDIALDADGRILLAGVANVYRYSSGNPRRSTIALARLDPAGRLDASWNGDGLMTKSLNGNRFTSAKAVALALDGHATVAAVSGPQANRLQTSVLRIGAQGDLDPTFATNGIASLTFGRYLNQAATGIALTPTGEAAISATASKSWPVDSPGDVVLARVPPGG